MSAEHITASDAATLRERIGERRAENIKGVIDLLIERADALPKVLYGDYVSHKERNLLVDVFKLSISLYPLYFPADEYIEYVKQMRFVTRGDIIEPSDHNLVKYALKALVDAVKKQLAEGLVLPYFSEEQISFISEKVEDKVSDVELKIMLIREVDYGDIVLHIDYNYAVDAVREALKILWYIIPFEIELFADIMLGYDCTLVSYDLILQIFATYDCTLYALDAISQIFFSLSYTLTGLDISADVPLSLHVTTVTADALAEVLAPVSITLYSLDVLIELLPELQVTLYSLSLEQIISLIYDFPTHITEFLPISTVGETVKVVSGYGDILLTYNFPPLVQGAVQMLLSYDLPPIVSASAEASLAYDLPPIVSALANVFASYDLPTILTSDAPVSAVCEIVPTFMPAVITYTEILAVMEETLHALDASVAACCATVHTFLESLDLASVTNLNMYETLHALDLVPEVVAELNTTLYSADADAEGVATIEETLHALDASLIPSCFYDVTLYAPSITAEPEVSYEYELHYWLSPEWRYRRRITVHNWTQEVSDYAVMIVLTPETFDYGKVREDGADIRITKEDGYTKLPYWIERWCYGGKSIIWVKVDNLPLGATDLWLYYGNPSATSEERPHEVFAEFLSPLDVIERVRCDVYVGSGAKPARVS